MISQLHDICRRILTDGTVRVVIGYGRSTPGGPVHPIFVTRAEDIERLVWNDQCYANLTTYLTRREIRALGKPAIVVKGCDERALVVLEKDSQIDRKELVVIGMACEGVGRPRLAKCATCDVHMPRFADEVIGKVENPPVEPAQRYAALDEFLKKSPEERMAWWMEQLDRCVKCYACRQVCPLCYCERCIADKNRPTVIDTSATLKGNFAWQIARAFHQAARCVGCGECARACPAGIPLDLLNQTLARAAEEEFHFRAGMDRDAEPLVGAYSLEDKENFIQ